MMRKRNENHVDMQFPTASNTYLSTVDEEATSTESEEDFQRILYPEQERNENQVDMQYPTAENTYLPTDDERATESEENFHRILYPEQDDYRSARTDNEIIAQEYQPNTSPLRKGTIFHHSSQILVETKNSEHQAQDESRQVTSKFEQDFSETVNEMRVLKHEVNEFQNLKEQKEGKFKREKKYQMKFEDTLNVPKKSTEDNLRDLLKSISEKKEKKGAYSVRGQEHGTITESIILKQLNESSLNETENLDFNEDIFSTNATHTSTGIYDDFQNRDSLHGSQHDVSEMDHTERYGKIISERSHTNGSSNAKNMSSSSHANHDQDVIDTKRSRGLFVPNISSKNGIQSENDVSSGIDIPSRKVVFKEDTLTKEDVPSRNVRFIENYVDEPYDEREESVDYDYLSSNDYDGRDIRSFTSNESDIYELDYSMSNPLDMLKGALTSYF
mmetsp:Transcript_27422/g.54861  ORF Transcript_27422/g.54861 Transcript_27422/m.54861 type:complete len:444 (-) Transcript_27422:411-1742(-)